MGEAVGIRLGVIGALFLSVASSVSIVICNKALMSNLSFPFGRTPYDNPSLLLTNTIQKKLDVSSTQLLYQSAPFQATILFVSGPLVDQSLTKQNVFAYRYSSIVLGCIVLSCLIAVAVNFSTFLVIGKKSPVTFQVLGHLKTCLMLVFGYMLLHDPFTHRNFLGILVAILGMGLHSYFCVQDNNKKPLVDLSSQVKAKEDAFPILAGKNTKVGHQDKESQDVKKSDREALDSFEIFQPINCSSKI